MGVGSRPMASAPDPVVVPGANRKSYRTKGKASSSGQLLRGALLPPPRSRCPGNVRTITGFRSSSSIPSKFETVLHAGNKERNAFNCRVYRFNEHESDLPGVGKYNTQGVPLNTSTSVSKRGMGMMASKDFTNKSFTWTGIKAAVPGPGSYCPESQFDKTWQPEVTDRCLFAGRNGKSFYSSDLTPGPGDYEPSAAPSSSVKPADCGAAFNSRAIRLKDKRSKCPAPGAYEIAKLPFSKHDYGGSMPSSSFTSGVMRDKVADTAAKKNAQLPGPSSYDGIEAHKLGLHGAGSHMFTGKVAKAPFAFADQEVIEARLQAKHDGTPGPGSYFDPDKPGTQNPKVRQQQATGSFKSKSSRTPSFLNPKKTPGPSHYKAPGIGKALKKSFHLNTTGTWV